MNTVTASESLTPTTPGFLDGIKEQAAKGGRAMQRAARKATLEDLRTPDMNRTETPGTKMLMALGATGKHVYGGTVDPAEVARRRAANRAARRARAAAKRSRR